VFASFFNKMQWWPFAQNIHDNFKITLSVTELVQKIRLRINRTQDLICYFIVSLNLLKMELKFLQKRHLSFWKSILIICIPLVLLPMLFIYSEVKFCCANMTFCITCSWEFKGCVKHHLVRTKDKAGTQLNTRFDLLFHCQFKTTENGAKGTLKETFAILEINFDPLHTIIFASFATSIQWR